MTLLLTVPVAVFVGTATVSAWIITCSGVVLTVSDSVRTARSEGLHTAVVPQRDDCTPTSPSRPEPNDALADDAHHESRVSSTKCRHISICPSSDPPTIRLAKPK